MRRLLLGVAAALTLLAVPAPAGAHPLGNFSVNHLTRVAVDRDQVRLQYVLDQAEIPTFQERRLGDAAVLGRKRDEVRRRLVLLVDGRRVALRFGSAGRLSHPPGQGGLPVTRVELSLTAPASGARSVVVHDETFAGRIGWKAVVAQPGSGTAVRSTAPSGDPTNGLRSYPRDQLQSPLDDRDATLAVRAGDGSLTAPRSAGAGAATTTNRAGDGLTGVFDRAATGKGALLLLLLAASGWGALHALSPGHGKAMVAAYLVGTRGTARHAIALGLIVTVTHTVGVFALGVVTLLLSQYLLPEQLFPWLTLVSGLLILVIGGAVLRARIHDVTARRAPREHAHAGHDHAGHDHAGHDHAAHDHASHDGEGHDHDPAGREHAGHAGHDHAGHDHAAHGHAGHDHAGHDHAGHDHAAHGHAGHDHAGHGHAHGHSHAVPSRLTWRGLTAMGASAGIIPCPSALVVLLGAVAQHQVGLGLILIVAFSLGLAATLTGLGLAVVWAGRLTARVPVWGPLAAGLPTASALVIVLVGIVLTARAIPNVV